MENQNINGKILVIPDVHGRTFWKEATNKFPDLETIFLGDYLDPYPDEGISEQQALENFKDILNFAKINPKSTLLLGNHDLHYFIDLDGCRKDWRNAPLIRKLFLDNLNLFSLVSIRDIDGKKFIFSHAPILMEWIKDVGETTDPDILVSRLNGYLHNYPENRGDLEDTLNHVSSYRGGWHEWGSPVWCDIFEIYDKGATLLPDVDMNIFGHTQIKRPIITDELACLDCRNAFLIDSEGKLFPAE